MGLPPVNVQGWVLPPGFSRTLPAPTRPNKGQIVWPRVQLKWTCCAVGNVMADTTLRKQGSPHTLNSRDKESIIPFALYPDKFSPSGCDESDRRSLDWQRPASIVLCLPLVTENQKVSSCHSAIAGRLTGSGETAIVGKTHRHSCAFRTASTSTRAQNFFSLSSTIKRAHMTNIFKKTCRSTASGHNVKQKWIQRYVCIFCIFFKRNTIRFFFISYVSKSPTNWMSELFPVNMGTHCRTFWDFLLDFPLPTVVMQSPNWLIVLPIFLSDYSVVRGSLTAFIRERGLIVQLWSDILCRVREIPTTADGMSSVTWEWQ